MSQALSKVQGLHGISQPLHLRARLVDVHSAASAAGSERACKRAERLWSACLGRD